MIIAELINELTEELQALEKLASSYIKDIEEAAKAGDFSENQQYHDSKAKFSELSGLINIKQQQLAALKTKVVSDTLTLFSVINVHYPSDPEDDFQAIVVPEAIAEYPRGFISVKAPLIQALLGNTSGTYSYNSEQLVLSIINN